jgi:hypothetical protein
MPHERSRRPQLIVLCLLLGLLPSCGSKEKVQKPGDHDVPDQTDSTTVQILALADGPYGLTLMNGDLYWCDGSESPIKKVPAAGGATTALAARAESFTGLAIRDSKLYWLDLRDGTSPSGCVGQVVAHLMSASVGAESTGSPPRTRGTCCNGSRPTEALRSRWPRLSFP